MARVANPYFQEHQEVQGGTPLGEIGVWDKGWIALECDCRATLVFEAQSACLPSRRLLECGVCGKRFAKRSSGR